MSKRRFGQTRALVSLAIASLRIPLWLASAPGNRRRHELAFFARLANGFGIHVSRHGIPSTLPATLFVMNHISWADIPVIMAILDADFVAKADMLDWQVIGPLARRFNPVFVARSRQHSSHDQIAAIRSRLMSGRSVILCAEGTTSDGATILPFRTSLFAAADVASVIQPLIVSYFDAQGHALSPQRRRDVAWIDDDDLFTGARRIAAEKTMARIEFLPPVTRLDDRKALATAVRRQMLAAYAAAANRPR